MQPDGQERVAAKCQRCGSTVDSFGFCRCEAGPTLPPERDWLDGLGSGEVQPNRSPDASDATTREAEADAKLVGHYRDAEDAIADRHVVATIGRGVALLQERGWAVADIETVVGQHLSAAYDREESK